MVRALRKSSAPISAFERPSRARRAIWRSCSVRTTIRPVLALQMPSNPSVTRFYTTILTAMGAPVRKTYQIAALEQVALRLLRGAGVRMLVIDELHNVFGGTGDRRREFLNLLRFLGTSCGSHWSGSALARRISRSVPTTSWRTASPR